MPPNIFLISINFSVTLNMQLTDGQNFPSYTGTLYTKCLYLWVWSGAVVIWPVGLIHALCHTFSRDDEHTGERQKPIVGCMLSFEGQGAVCSVDHLQFSFQFFSLKTVLIVNAQQKLFLRTCFSPRGYKCGHSLRNYLHFIFWTVKHVVIWILGHHLLLVYY